MPELTISPIPPELALPMFLAEHLLGYRWLDGPAWDYHGKCAAHRVLAPGYAHDRGYVWPPTGVIPSTFFVDGRWPKLFQEAYNVIVGRMKVLGWGFMLIERTDAPASDRTCLAGFERHDSRGRFVRVEAEHLHPAMAICLAAKEAVLWAQETEEPLAAARRITTPPKPRKVTK